MKKQLSLDELQKDWLFKCIWKALKQVSAEVYLVGGYLRNRLLGLEGRDVDLIIEGEATPAANRIKEQTGGSMFTLGSPHLLAAGDGEMIRIVTQEDEKTWRTIDLSPVRKNLASDLRQRDFTINAVAVSIHKLTVKKRLDLPADLIDPTGGWLDLKSHILRPVSKNSFRDDPLRLLRAVRLAHELELTMDSAAADLVYRQASLLSRVSGERIQEELWRLLQSSQSYKAIGMCDALGLIDSLFPELAALKGVTQGQYHHLDVFSHTLFALESLEAAADGWDYFFPGYGPVIKDELGSNRRLVILKLATLLHDIGKPLARTVDGQGKIRFLNHTKLGLPLVKRVVEQLKLSKRDGNSCIMIIEGHMHPGFLTQQSRPACQRRSARLSLPEGARLPLRGTSGQEASGGQATIAGRVSKRTIYRFLRKYGKHALEVILLSLADQLATQGPAMTGERQKEHLAGLRLLTEGYFAQEKTESCRLLTGSDIVTELGLKPGPIVGQILNQVEEAQFEGKISTRVEAIDLARSILRSLCKP